MTQADETSRYESTAAVLTDLETLSSNYDYISPTQAIDRSRHELLSSKIMAVLTLIGLVIISTAIVTNRVQVSQPAIDDISSSQPVDSGSIGRE